MLSCGFINNFHMNIQQENFFFLLFSILQAESVYVYFFSGFTTYYASVALILIWIVI